MDTYFGGKPQNPNFIDLVKAREIKESAARRLAQKTIITEELVSRLGLEKELEGHNGCINSLEWSECGEVLATASDDMRIFFWNAFNYKELRSFSTGHMDNIFSVKFVPQSCKSMVATGAGDARVKVFNSWTPTVLYSCSCHTGRVKKIATADSTPFLLWSAAEDGLVVQHDLRAPHNCTTDRTTILVDLTHDVPRYAEAKCMAVNPARQELVAVGANDAYVRMYDRRMLKLGQAPADTFFFVENHQIPSERVRKTKPGDNPPLECSQYLIAGHLRSRTLNKVRNYGATYVTFSANGTELLVNMGGEHVYLFDIMNPRLNRLFDIPNTESFDKCEEGQDSKHLLLSSAYGTDSRDTRDYTLINTKVLPDHVEEIKQEANEKFKLQKYIAATELYNKALGYCPTASVLYGNRAAALMKREWDGDVYAALRDCQTTLLLDPGHVKAHFRLARCLHDLDRPNEAYKVIQDFEEFFPSYTNNSAFHSLKFDITKLSRNVKASSPFPPTESVAASARACRACTTVDYKLRYCGHCNTTTDIKEANFLGSEGQYIITGSDDGNIFIWDRHTTNIVRILRGDTKIVNCLQPHPSSCLIATSGIDSVIRLWSPLPEDGKPNDRQVANHLRTVIDNDIRRTTDPFELMMVNMGFITPQRSVTVEDVASDDSRPVYPRPSVCNPS